ncbi:MAG: ferredoxin family protein [Eubacteriales bacterium]
MDLQKQVSVDCYRPPKPGSYIINAIKCREDCIDTKCVWVCPAGLFSKTERGVILESDGFCLECGACRLICDNIVFDYPPAGKGVIHRFG